MSDRNFFTSSFLGPAPALEVDVVVPTNRAKKPPLSLELRPLIEDETLKRSAVDVRLERPETVENRLVEVRLMKSVTLVTDCRRLLAAPWMDSAETRRRGSESSPSFDSPFTPFTAVSGSGAICTCSFTAKLKTDSWRLRLESPLFLRIEGFLASAELGFFITSSPSSSRPSVPFEVSRGALAVEIIDSWFGTTGTTDLSAPAMLLLLNDVPNSWSVL
mmetsp:Transcript_92821/g.165024  ORF Transcript_92821/g.165024 Transcript_92821/m.165024 type:complete len:218 (-) Transcript_92821:392-1045(-)